MSLQVVEDTALMSKDLLLSEYRLHRCGRFLAMHGNLQDGINIIRNYRPQLHRAVWTRLEEGVLSFAEQHRVEECADEVLGMRVMRYRHFNEEIPAFWANYAFKFAELQ